MIVEGQGIGFWTRVRLPPTPLNGRYTNTYPSIDFSAFRNVFGITVYMKDFDFDEDPYPLTIGGVRRYVRDEYGIEVSNGSVCSVRDKCKADKIGLGTAKVVPELKSERELAIYEAFKALGMVLCKC